MDDRPTATASAASAIPGVPDDLLRRLEGVLRAGERGEVSEDPARADTTVEIAVRTSRDVFSWATLLLDRSPVEVVPDGVGDAEIGLEFEPEHLRAFVDGELQLALAIADGRVAYSGPVRKFLRITPVLRGLAAAERGAPLTGAGATARVEVPDSPAGAEAWSEADEHGYHRGALEVAEEYPGDYWCINCRDVHKSFAENDVLRGLDLGIPEGTISVILGPSGTGKSVLIKHIIGLLFPDAGTVAVHGYNVQDLRLSKLLALRRKFGILFQDGALFASMNLYDNVAFPLRQHTQMTEPEIAEVTNRRLEDMGLVGSEAKMPAQLSGGMRKRAGFARALVLEPEIVLFDEPDSGLDPVRTSLLCDVIKRAHLKHGGTYVLITHDIATARRIGEYIALLWRGRIVEAGAPEKVFASANPFVRQFLAGQTAGPLSMD